jgi:hypothetical protein
MNTRIYKIDFEVIRQWKVPSLLRLDHFVVWLKALIYPIEVLSKTGMMPYKKAKDYELYITPQVCYLETLLNDRYDKIQRRIFIEDGLGFEPLWLYTDDELHPIDLYTSGEGITETLYTEGEVNGALSNDYVINIPAGVSFVPNELVSLVKKFHLFGMRFDIQIF